MLASFTLLLVYQLLGEGIARALPIAIPGPVVGMVLLFVTLAMRGMAKMPGALELTARSLLRYLALLFVPAGVGIMQYGDRLQREGWALALVLLVSTLLTLALTALLLQWFAKRADHVR
jgi:holin-like protein